MIENEVEVFLEFELPGFTRKDLNIKIEKNSISINGEKKTESKEDKKNVHSYEKTSRSFSYSSSLPNVNPDKAKIEFIGDALKITIPKK